jgi:uncharacterized protein (DUF697 family)
METQEMSPNARIDTANGVMKNYVIISMGAGLVPIPIFDVVALTGIQLKMLHSLTKVYNIEFSENVGKSLIASLLGGILPTTAGISLASAAKIIPFSGLAIGMVSTAVFGGAVSYAVGKVFIQHFETGGTLLTFDPMAMREYFAKEFEEGKQVVKNFKNSGTEPTQKEASEPQQEPEPQAPPAMTPNVTPQPAVS